MKPWIAIFSICIIFISCSQQHQEMTNEPYIKLIVLGDAHEPNAYNKGIGAHYYSYFNLRTDSIFYMYPQFQETEDYSLSHINHAYKGMLNNSKFKDTLQQLIQALNWRPIGSIDNISNGSTYSGWTFYVEYRMKDTLKYYTVSASISDTLDWFYDFFISLENAAWDKIVANPKDLDIDSEVVSAMKMHGFYEGLDIPYLFPECDSGVDFSKLIGRWRSVGNSYHSTKKNLFMLLTFNPERTFLVQKYMNGELEDVFKGTYTFDEISRKIYYTSTTGSRMYHAVKQLTDSCFSGIEHVQENGKHNIKFNRY